MLLLLEVNTHKQRGMHWGQWDSSNIPTDHRCQFRSLGTIPRKPSSCISLSLFPRLTLLAPVYHICSSTAHPDNYRTARNCGSTGWPQPDLWPLTSDLTLFCQAPLVVMTLEYTFHLLYPCCSVSIATHSELDLIKKPVEREQSVPRLSDRSSFI